MNSQAGETVIVEDKSGARHRIEARFLSPVVFSLKEISGIALDKTRAAKLFFNCADAPEEIAGTHAFDYVAAGERAGYHLRPTCRARSPWYGVARGRKPAPLIFPSKVGERWVVALNRDGVFEDKKLYGIFPRKGVSTDCARGAAQFDLGALLRRVDLPPDDRRSSDCRHRCGRGRAHTYCPTRESFQPKSREGLQAALRMLAQRPIFSIFEEVNRHDRRRLDDLVLTAIGFTERREREALLDELYEAVTKLVRERLDKTLSQPGSGSDRH